MPCAMASVALRTFSMSLRPNVTGGSAHAESPEWMPASSMCSMIAADVDLGAVAQRVDVDLDRVLEEAVDQHRVLRATARWRG